MTKKRINLAALTGTDKSFIEIDAQENGDFYVLMVGQDTTGKKVFAQGQIPNPVNGGGDLEMYNSLKKVYDILGESK